MKEYLIALGGPIYGTPNLKKWVSEKNFAEVIAADGGLRALKEIELQPGLMIGDFDSVDPLLLEQYETKGIPMKRFPAKKDLTDAELALEVMKEMAEPGDEIWFLGGLGGRLDHTLANVFLLEEAYKQGFYAHLFNGIDEARFLQGPCECYYEKRPYQQYFSLVALSEKVTGITLKGFAYPLQDAKLRRGQTLGISNELVEAIGHVIIEDGKVFVIRSADHT